MQKPARGARGAFIQCIMHETIVFMAQAKSYILILSRKSTVAHSFFADTLYMSVIIRKTQYKRFILFFALFLLAFAILTPQTEATESSLPTSYGGVSLGMSVEQTKEALKANSIFGYRGDRDVSLLPTQERTLIETSGHSFFSRCWFQFYENKLYTMIFNINSSTMDYYTLFKNFEKKYGPPTSLNPEKVIWKNDAVTMSLERPLTIKYVDTQLFESLLNTAKTEKATSDIVRESFLDSF